MKTEKEREKETPFIWKCQVFSPLSLQTESPQVSFSRFIHTHLDKYD